MTNGRIILFGGSFDPIHLGHIEVARASQAKLQAQEVIFIPAKQSPHKNVEPSASPADRLHMIALAIANDNGFRVSPCEIDRPSPSYTLDTVKLFRDETKSNTELCFLIGADAIPDLHRWYRIEELMSLCRLCTMCRGGFDKPDFSILKNQFPPERIAQLEHDVIRTPMLNISSTEIRRMLSDGKSVVGIVPGVVAGYIRKNRLYSSH